MAARKKVLAIAEWEKQQPKHGDRSFPWIRNYSSRLEDPNWRKLTKAQRSDLNDLELLANRVSNRIPDDPGYLTRYLRLDEPIELQALIDAGFVCRQSAGKRTTKKRQDDGLGKGRSGEVRREKNRSGEDSGNVGEVDGTNLSTSSFGHHLSQPANKPTHPKELIEILGILFPTIDGRVQLSPFEAQGLLDKFPHINVQHEAAKFAEYISDGNAKRPTKTELVRSLEGWLHKARSAGYKSSSLKVFQ